MKKLISLFLIFSLTTHAAPPTGVGSQSSSTLNYSNNTIAPYRQATKLAGVNTLIETGNQNMLVNGDFEAYQVIVGGTTGWIITSGVGNILTDQADVSSGKQAQQIATTNGVSLNLSQSVTTPGGIQKQGVVGALYKSSLSTFQVCSLVDGQEQTCVPSKRLVLNGTYQPIEIPIIFGTTSAGIKFKSGASVGTTIHAFDAAYVKQGLGTQNLMLDNVYSATVTTTSGAVANESKDFIASCTAANPTVCTFNAGYFSVTPNCSASQGPQAANNVITPITAVSSTGFTLSSNLASTNALFGSQAATVTCQKSGNDYLASSANVYSSTNGNYDWTSYTATSSNNSFQAFGTNECQHARDGADLLLRCKISASTLNASEARIDLPNSLTSANSTKIPSIQLVGDYSINVNSASRGLVLIEPSTSYVTFGIQASTRSGLTKVNASDLTATSSPISFTARIPISGWSNSNVIVGSFAGTPKVPGYDGNVDTFSVTFAANSSLNSACTTGSCYIDQIGSAATFVDFVSAGNYDLKTAKTYAKLKCQFIPYFGSQTLGTYNSNLGSCANCNTLRVTSLVPSTGTATNSGGLIDCKGSY